MVPKEPKSRRLVRAGRQDYWVLQDAKARFSELIRRVRSEGPQHVTVHGRDEVVVISSEEFRRLRPHPSRSAIPLLSATKRPIGKLGPHSWKALWEASDQWWGFWVWHRPGLCERAVSSIDIASAL